MKKKVGIITFHSSHNCGSMLQAYALQSVLANRYNVDAEIIDYINKGSRNLYGYVDLRLKKSAIEHNINTFLHLNAVRKSRHDYINFSKKYLITSKEKYYNHTNLKKSNDKYDIFIAGGDQVWNILCADADDAYFLDFVDDKEKVAYSPSLGGNNIGEVAKNPQKYANLIKNFNYLSVREPNGKKWLENLVGGNIPIIADPTLLFTADEWIKRFQLPHIEKPFIFNYAFFHNRPEANKAMQRISEELKMPVYIIDMKSWYFYHLDKYGIKCYDTTGPLAFLTLMYNASLVLTQSFHGTLFASLFHKQFWSYRAPAIKKIDDDRATAILDQLGLRDRYVVIDDLPDMNYRKTIDYSHTDSLISNMRNKAFEYLDSIME